MARLQILELPEGAGDDRPPFVLVVDQVPTDGDGYPLKVHVEGDFEKFREQIQEEIAKAQAKTVDALRRGLR